MFCICFGGTCVQRGPDVGSVVPNRSLYRTVVGYSDPKPNLPSSPSCRTLRPSRTCIYKAGPKNKTNMQSFKICSALGHELDACLHASLNKSVFSSQITSDWLLICISKLGYENSITTRKKVKQKCNCIVIALGHRCSMRSRCCQILQPPSVSTRRRTWRSHSIASHPLWS